MADERATDKKTNKASSKAAKPAPVKSLPKGNIATFNDRIFINLDKELAHYSTSHIKAYEAGTSASNPTGYFAMICNPIYVSRTHNATAYKKITNKMLPTLVDHGCIKMPSGFAYGYIYDIDIGEPLFQSNDNIALGWSPDETLEKIVFPIVNCLQALQQHNMTHGNIRATNLFFNEHSSTPRIRLGECLSSPVSFNQPAHFEPIERAMALPNGRSDDEIKDDLYALGVLVGMHVRNFDPLKGKTEDEIIASKVILGSYASIIGNSDRIGTGISDLIRGLLVDDIKYRWTLDEVVNFMEGRRQIAKQPVKVKKAPRAIKFNGREFYFARTFAHRLLQHPKDAATLVEGNELNHWIERSLGNNEISMRVERAHQTASDKGRGGAYWDFLLPRLSIALDPLAPIRYKGYSFHPLALGNILAEAYLQKSNMDVFLDYISSGIMEFWVMTCADLNMDVLDYTQFHDRMKSFLRQNTITFGLERCLYSANPSIHCLSHLVVDYHVTDAISYIQTLDLIASKNTDKHPKRIIDKHAACFLISKDTRFVDPYSYDLGSTENHRYALANLQVLASIQKSEQLAPLPHLCNWVCSLLDPVIERYHDENQRKAIEKEIEKEKINGNLYEILDILNDDSRIKKDQREFRRAMISYRELDLEERKISNRLKNPKYYADKLGQEWAATVSGIIAVLIILGFLMVHYGTGVKF